MMLKMLDWKMIKLWPKAGAAKGGCFDLQSSVITTSLSKVK